MKHNFKVGDEVVVVEVPEYWTGDEKFQKGSTFKIGSMDTFDGHWVYSQKSDPKLKGSGIEHIYVKSIIFNSPLMKALEE